MKNKPDGHKNRDITVRNRPGQKIIVVVGPTASGKSDLAINIAKRSNGEIISADSRQVYRGMDIGTGKVTEDGSKVEVVSRKNGNKKSEYYSEGVRHYLLDVASPKKQFTAANFKELGEEAIETIAGGSKIPIIAGGTGFYIDILTGRTHLAEVPPIPGLRAELEKQSAEHLFEQLSGIDPARAETIDRHNKRRLVRAIEIATMTEGSSLDAGRKDPDTRYKILWLGINPGKEELAKKIKKRLDDRLEQGMIKEVRRLHKEGVSWKRLDGFGLEYRQISQFLRNYKLQITNYKKLEENFKNSGYYANLLSEIIKYSKRQMTWFKRNKDIHWVKNKKEALLIASKFLS